MTVSKIVQFCPVFSVNFVQFCPILVNFVHFVNIAHFFIMFNFDNFLRKNSNWIFEFNFGNWNVKIESWNFKQYPKIWFSLLNLKGQVLWDTQFIFSGYIALHGPFKAKSLFPFDSPTNLEVQQENLKSREMFQKRPWQQARELRINTPTQYIYTCEPY